jgi:hypothetical protein
MPLTTHFSVMAISIFFLFSVAAIAEESQQDKYKKRFHNIMTTSSYPIALKNGEMSGEGVDFLIENARRSQFFMIGEQHGTSDIALFSRAIYARLTTMGYSKIALEVGPWSTIFAENLMRSDLKAYEAFMSDKKTYLALPFLFFQEEGDIAFDAIQADGVKPVLWGLDQEYMAAAPILLPLLSKQAKTIAEHDAVGVARRAAADNMMYVGMADETALTDLRAVFEKRNDSAALELIDAMIISNRIYKPFTGRGGTSYAGNLERENYMKTNFLKHFKQARSNEPIAPKVFMKFGAYHGSRGRSGTNVPALLDFLVEWGRSEGYSSFNIHMDCRGGMSRDIRSGSEVPCEGYFLNSKDGETDPFAEHIPKDGMAILDLRGLRPYATRMKFLGEDVINLIYAYDAYLAMPNVGAATTYRQSLVDN